MEKFWMNLMLMVLLGVAGVAVSEVIAYDTFQYEPGEIVGQSAPAFGFIGSWGGGGGNLPQCTVQPSSLVYPGADSALQERSGMGQVIVPLFEGARAGRFLNTDPNGPFADYLNAQGAIGRPGTTLYISFLMRTSHTTPFYAFELKRSDLGDGGARLYVGNDVGGSDLQVCAYRNRDLSAGNIGRQFQWLGPATTNVELFVVRIDFGQTGDHVTVYRNPSLDAEPVLSPHLVDAGLLDFDAISFAAWVDPAGRTAQFDEFCIASTYADAVRFYNMPKRAQSPFPADGAAEVAAESEMILQWQAGSGVSPTGYKVYFSENLDDVLAEAESACLGIVTEPEISAGLLRKDATYYWSVRQLAEPNDIPGVIWMFETEKTYPTFLRQPEDQRIFAGQQAVFSVEVSTESPENYQWYRSDVPLSDGGNVSGAQTPTLLVADAQLADEGEYYCEVTNSAGAVVSRRVVLKINRMVGYWNLDQPAGTDPNAAWMDLSGNGNDLQPVLAVPSSFTWVEGADGTAGGALVFNGQFALGTKRADGLMKDIPIRNEPYTILAWFKTTPKVQGIIGWGNYGFYNQCNAIAMYPDTPAVLKNYWWDNDLAISRGYSLVDDAWHQVVVTYDGSRRIGYLDGIQAGTDTPPPHNVPNSSHFLIGKTNDTNPAYELFSGAIDEVRVYNYALSPMDVASAYTKFTGQSLCVYPPVYDVNGDCRVDLEDLALLTNEWLTCGLVPDCIQ